MVFLLVVCLCAAGATDGWSVLSPPENATAVTSMNTELDVLAGAGAALGLLVVLLVACTLCCRPPPPVNPTPRATPKQLLAPYPDHAYIVLAS
jgi:hypothetical protein